VSLNPIYVTVEDERNTVTITESSTTVEMAQSIPWAQKYLLETTSRSGTYTLQLSDIGMVVPFEGLGTHVAVIPHSSSVPFPIGCVLTICNLSTSDVLVSVAAGVSLRGQNYLLSQYEQVTLRKRASDEWILSSGIPIIGGSSPVATLDALDDVTIAVPSDGQYLGFNGTNWVNTVSPTGEPTGHKDKEQSTISFNKSNRTFTISPVSGSFEVWCTGRRYVFTSAQSIQIPNSTGLYYIYFNSVGVLSQKSTYFTWDQDAPTAYIYWNAIDGEAYFFADERHGIVVDWQTHEYLHRTRGAAYASGFGLTNYSTSGSGSSNAHIQMDITNGTFFDEDIQIDITHSAMPTANTWQQVLQGGCEIPIFYRSGSAWKATSPTKFPLKQGTLAQYNLNTSGTWSTVDLGTNKYGVTWVAATNNLNYPVIGIMGQAEYDNLNKVALDNWNSLNLTGLPIFEIRPLWEVTYLTSNGFANTPKSAIREVTDIRFFGIQPSN
jgi:hypothetical protein